MEKQLCPRCKTMRLVTDFGIKRLDEEYKTCRICRDTSKLHKERKKEDNEKKRYDETIKNEEANLDHFDNCKIPFGQCVTCNAVMKSMRKKRSGIKVNCPICCIKVTCGYFRLHCNSTEHKNKIKKIKLRIENYMLEDTILREEENRIKQTLSDECDIDYNK